MDASSVSPWQVAAGAYWAARANLVARRPDRVTHYLRIAAAHDHTFYGIVARRALAMENSYDWRAPSLDPDRLALLMGSDWGRRALALLPVCRPPRAEQERKVQADLAYSHGDGPADGSAKPQQVRRLPNWGKKGRKRQRQQAEGAR